MPTAPVLTLNALLGLGTALAPVFVAVFVGLGFWWGLPILSTVLLGPCSCSPALGFRCRPRRRKSREPVGAAGIPPRFWLFAGFAVLYGICETMNGNWSQTDMTSSVGASTTQAALALTAFWAMVTVGRLLFAAMARWLPTRVVFRLLPLVARRHLRADRILPEDDAVAGRRRLRAGGPRLLGTAASHDQSRPGALTTMSAAVAGGVIAFYQVGYGIAAFGVGPLVDHGRQPARPLRLDGRGGCRHALLSFVIARDHRHLRSARRGRRNAATHLRVSSTPSPEADAQAHITQVGATLRTFTVGGQDVIDGFPATSAPLTAEDRCWRPGPTGSPTVATSTAGGTARRHSTRSSRHDAIHGLVRWLDWSLVERDLATITLACAVRPQPGYEWQLDLEITYAVDDAGLTVTFTAVNADSEPAPFGVGFHPYAHPRHASSTAST